MAECNCRGAGTSLHRADCPAAVKFAEQFGWLKAAPKWDEPESCANRARLCLLFLNVHGVITDGEKVKAIRRLKRLIEKEP